MVITKYLFLVSLMLASALATETPATAALLVQSNFDFSLTRNEFRVHFSGLKGTSQETASIRIYNPDGQQVLSYNIQDKTKKKAYHFALKDVKAGTYEVEVCEGNVCSAKTTSLHDITQSGQHMLSCEVGQIVDGLWKHDASKKDIEVAFVGPKENAWADISDYTDFETTVINARKQADPNAKYETDFKKYDIKKNPSYKKVGKVFHAAIMYDLTVYKQLFDTYQGSSDVRSAYVDDYCGRKFMLSLHSHVVNEKTNEVEYRFKTVNYLSEGGKKFFILGQPGRKILLETTHKGVEIKDGTYTLWVSLCVTNKDAIESTYCASPITKEFKVEGEE